MEISLHPNTVESLLENYSIRGPSRITLCARPQNFHTHLALFFFKEILQFLYWARAFFPWAQYFFIFFLHYEQCTNCCGDFRKLENQCKVKYYLEYDGHLTEILLYINKWNKKRNVNICCFFFLFVYARLLIMLITKYTYW